MKYKELSEKETPQLQHDLLEARRHLFTLKSQAVTEKLEDPSQLRKTRKDIARLMTALHQRGLDKKNAATETTVVPASAATRLRRRRLSSRVIRRLSTRSSRRVRVQLF